MISLYKYLQVVSCRSCIVPPTNFSNDAKANIACYEIVFLPESSLVSITCSFSDTPVGGGLCWRWIGTTKQINTGLIHLETTYLIGKIFVGKISVGKVTKVSLGDENLPGRNSPTNVFPSGRQKNTRGHQQGT